LDKQEKDFPDEKQKQKLDTAACNKIMNRLIVHLCGKPEANNPREKIQKQAL
jgi:hypothetical protein